MWSKTGVLAKSLVDTITQGNAMQTITTGPEIYKQDSAGKVRTWQYLVGTDGNDWGWATVSGTKGGQKVTSTWRKVTGKNVGRSNETSPEQQAHLEAEASMDKKLERGYFRDLGNVGTFDKFKPMLAIGYEKAAIAWEKGVYVQPKLDGIRCIARADGLWTRQGKPIVSVPHIFEALKPMFWANPNLILDGELYNHDLRDDFNKITSLVRKLKPTAEDLKETASMVQYHIYDMPCDKGFGDRRAAMHDLLWHGWLEGQSYPCKPVPTNKITSQEEADDFYGQYLEAGYEGQMVRLDGVGYEQNKRSKSLIKRKEFLTDEFPVVAVEEGAGNWSGHVKRFIIDLGDGKTCGAGVRGSQEQLKALFEDGKKPDWATLRYFTPTPDGVPRFPVVVDYGFGVRED